MTLSLSAAVQAQPATPRPHPEPRVSTAKANRVPLPLTPVETVWGLALNNALTTPPAFDGTLALFPIEGDRLVAYDLLTGTQQWMITATPLMQPVAGGGLVFIIEKGALKALHAADGSAAWELPFTDPLAVHPVWDNGWLILAAASGEIRALRATDGHLIWSRDLKSPAHAPPALAADRVYVPTTDSRIVALRVDNGEPIWERRLGGAPNDILALDERLYAGSQDNFFYCVMAADGKVDWRQRTGGDIIGKPVADDRLVYFVSLDNVLRAMNRVTGGQQWMRPLPMRPAWGAVKGGSTIVVAGQSAPLRAYNSKDGVAAGTLTGVTPPAEEPKDKAPAKELDEKAPAKEPDRKAPAEEPKAKAPAAFPALGPDTEVAAVPHVIEHPVTHVALVVLVFKEIAKGASATLLVHSAEPALIPVVAALPNLVQIAPVTPTTPPPRN